MQAAGSIHNKLWAIQLSRNCQIKKISGNLLHYSYTSITDHVAQTNKFTTIAAKAALAKGGRSSNFKIVSRPILKFLKDYFLKRGFMDGRYGFVICSWLLLFAQKTRRFKSRNFRQKPRAEEWVLLNSAAAATGRKKEKQGLPKRYIPISKMKLILLLRNSEFSWNSPCYLKNFDRNDLWFMAWRKRIR